MSNIQPLLSIVIPTKDRQQYAIAAIQSVLDIPSDEIEVVVHDTSDDDRLGSALSEICPDPRLRYYHTTPPMGFSETFDKGVSLARGEFIIIIGDDDGIHPEIMDAVRWMKAQKIDALTPSISATYGWPDFRLRYYGASEAGRLKVKKFTGRVSFPDPEKELKCVALKAFQSFCQLPKVYYGIVRRACLDRIRHRYGTCFWGASPDISGAIAIATEASSVCHLDYPLLIPGSSSRSGSGRSAMKLHVGELRQERQTRSFASNWPESIPKFYSVQTVWAQAAWEALSSLKRFDLLNQADLPLLHAVCMVYNVKYWRVIIRCLWNGMKNGRVGYVQGIFGFSGFIGLHLWFRAKSHIFKLFGIGYYKYVYEAQQVPDIRAAVGLLNGYLHAHNSVLAEYLQKCSFNNNNV